ncbi:hypothetical protein LOD99_3957 [Oopsacas minuta]|uniref:Cleavage and polyadenylation specificity factor subunit 1 n=1 Tax=Oopsacas minuta TaxID=111878 RepID=A0AAV7JW24_9METZ|nr:hypothetical protein LOD99_3957 [Oopsacas minuta]
MNALLICTNLQKHINDTYILVKTDQFLIIGVYRELPIKIYLLPFSQVKNSDLSLSLVVYDLYNIVCIILGSRLGNSLLLKFFPISSPKIHSCEKCDKSNIDDHVDHVQETNNQLKEIKDDIDLEMYGLSIFSENELYFRIGSYTFEVCDSLTNISPIASMTIGQPLNISEEFSESVDSDLELVGCVGHSKNGSLAVLQKSIHPQLVTTSELIGSQDMWTLKTNADEFHRFLLISQTDSTMILQTGQEILELDQDQTGFCTNEKTIFAGNVLSNQLFIQVCSDSILLLENLKCLQSISMKQFDSQVLACSICDPFGVLLLESNKLIFFEVHCDKSIVLSIIPVRSSLVIVSLSLYVDNANIFTIQPSTVKNFDIAINGGTQMHQKNEDEQFNKESEKFPSYWLALVKDNGCLEILSLPKFNTVFMVRNFSFAPVLLIDCGHIDSDSGVSESVTSTKSIVQEILFTSLDIDGKSPYLLAIINNDLVLYKAFRISYSSHDGHLLFRFRRELVSILMNDRNTINIEECETANFENVYSIHRKISPPRFREFSNIGTYPGVFICGPYPQWIFKSHKGTYFIHPMSIDGPVESFACFHNENCKFGCIYYNREGILRIALLPTFLNLESPWPLRKVPLRCTSHFVAYHIESKTYALALSNKMKGNILIKSTGDDTEEFETVSKGPRFIYPYQEKYFIELFSPTNWEAIPNTRFELYPFEHVTALKSLHLRSQERASGLKIFICVGTTVLYGEDFTAKGRILIFDIIDVVPEPGKPLTRNRLKLLYDKEQIGPISAIDHVDGLLFTCIGKKIFMWNFKDTKELIGVAFIDAELYIHSAISLKNYILVADISKSIQLLQYREDQKSLSLISKDPYQLRVYSIEYVIDGNQLGFLVSDSSKNLHLFQYQPDDPGSIGGLRLIRQGDIHIGSHINSMFRIRCKPAVYSRSTAHHITGMALNEKRHVTFYSTLDGSIGLIVPLSEKTFRRLQTLQSRLVQCIQHPAGLNPKSYRLAHMLNRLQSSPQKNIIDGDLLWKYTYLGIKEKNELAKQIGTSSFQIMEDIRNIEQITNIF